MMRSLLFALLLAAPGLANTLRGAAEPADTVLLEPESRELQDDKDLNVIDYVVVFSFIQNDPGRPGTDDELFEIKNHLHGWMKLDVLQPVMELDEVYDLDTTWGDEGLVTTLVESFYMPSKSIVQLAFVFTVKFEGVDAPLPPDFVAALKTQGAVMGPELLEAAERPAGFFNEGFPFADLSSVTTTPKDVVSWAVVGGGTARDGFDESYVLPCVITWSFKTPKRVAKYEDWDAAKNATKVWLQNYWDAIYEPLPGADLARRTTEVNIRSSSFTPQGPWYRQSVSLGVEILVGANNITDVPSARMYTTTMQMVGQVSNFTEILSDFLHPGSIYARSNQTGFAMTPTFEVMTLEESKNPGNSPIPDDLTSAASSFIVVL